MHLKLSVVDDFVAKEVSVGERKEALETVEMLWEVFGALEKKGFLRVTLRESAERAKFMNIMRDFNKLTAAYNMLFHVFEKRGRSKEFAKHNKTFGFDEDGVAYMFLSESVATVLRTTELFKNSFLYVLKTTRKKDAVFWPNMTLGELSRSLERITEGKSRRLMEKMDLKLRNALTHGLFWLEGSILVYCEDITLKEQKEIVVSELWIKGRAQSLTLLCLLAFIADYYHSV